MDVLTLDSKNYVKASVLARELGYTADYVGQLCRSGKVEAKLFGRSWYVDKDSIQSHKSTRYRTAHVKTVEAVQEAVKINIAIESKQQDTSEEMPLKKEKFYIHNSLKPSPRYISDDTELLPEISKMPKKEGNLRVNLADSSKVEINSSPEDYIFETPTRPQIKFKGSLSVSEVISSRIPVPDGGLVMHPEDVSHLISEKKPKNKVISSNKNVTHHKATLKLVAEDLDPVETLVAKVINKESSVNTTLQYSNSLVLVLSTFVSCACFILILCLEAHVAVDVTGSMVTTYSFKIDHLVASVYSAFLY